MTRFIGTLMIALLLSGCAVAPQDFARKPHLSPIGHGVQPNVGRIPVQPVAVPAKFKGNSFWTDNGADLFRDARARRLGDVLTVAISIQDQASLDNSSDRSRDSQNDIGLDWDVSIANKFGGQVAGTGNSTTGFNSKSTHKGEGAIARSERIDLRVASVVTDVLPNGNLIISGSQEVRVNFEVRVLSVSGIVNPRHITGDNTIEYDRIAEARISYGGRGRITEVQQPAWGHQLIDNISPF